MNAAQHQKQLDDAGDLEAMAERLEQDCRETLMNMEPWHYPEQVRPWAVKWVQTGEQDVTEALYDLCHSELCLALDGEPLLCSCCLLLFRILASSDDVALPHSLI